MQVTYQSPTYTPALVTGRYVRYERGMFKVFETATCNRKGQFFRMPGMGYTLREYITDGAKLPKNVKNAAKESRTTVKWD